MKIILTTFHVENFRTARGIVSSATQFETEKKNRKINWHRLKRQACQERIRPRFPDEKIPKTD